MKKLFIVLVLGSFLGVAFNANACDGHKAKASKTSTVTGKTTATTAVPVVTKGGKKAECTSHDPKVCTEKTGMDCSKASKTSSEATPSCCAKKAPAKKS